MKKTLYVVVLLVIFLAGFNLVSANNTPTISESPIVSIGIGNGNSPENNSPTHMGVYHGDVSVFGTVNDSDVESYHFRVIKDGGAEGHTCTEELGLFSVDNQGYASSTLGKSACGFNYNKSEFINTGFTNSLLAIVNTVDLGSFSGDGDYWFILGAKDQMGNRTNIDYTMDPRVKVIVDNTPPVTNGFVSVSGLEGPFTVQTTATDEHGVAQTNIYSAQSDGITCQAYSQAVSIAGTNATSSSMSVQWTPETSGTYCVGVASKDIPGNLESIKTLTAEIHFQLPTSSAGGTASTTTATTTAEVTPTPTPTPTATPTPTSSGSGSGGSEGSGTPTSSNTGTTGGSGVAANGPISNSFGVQNLSSTGGLSIANSEVQSQSNSKGLGPVYRDGIGGDLGVGQDETNNENMKKATVLTSNSDLPKSKDNKLVNLTGTTTSTSSDQLAQVITTGLNLNWLWWIILVVIILGGGYYFYFYRKE